MRPASAITSYQVISRQTAELWVVLHLQIGPESCSPLRSCRHVTLAVMCSCEVIAPQVVKRVRKKKGRSLWVPGGIWSANGSRKRMLILILNTQILLYSPTVLCYSTLRRQKPSASHVSDPADLHSVRVRLLLWFNVQRVKFSCVWLIPQHIAPRGGGQLPLYWP